MSYIFYGLYRQTPLAWVSLTEEIKSLINIALKVIEAHKVSYHGSSKGWVKSWQLRQISVGFALNLVGDPNPSSN